MSEQTKGEGTKDGGTIGAEFWEEMINRDGNR